MPLSTDFSQLTYKPGLIKKNFSRGALATAKKSASAAERPDLSAGAQTLPAALTARGRLRKEQHIFLAGEALSAESSDPVTARLLAALDNLEAAAERRTRREAALADAEAEFAVMQDDRARLAVELDAALDAQRKLGEANSAAMERIGRAAATLERWLNPREGASAKAQEASAKAQDE